jgi:hypothetical protein
MNGYLDKKDDTFKSRWSEQFFVLDPLSRRLAFYKVKPSKLTASGGAEHRFRSFNDIPERGGKSKPFRIDIFVAKRDSAIAVCAESAEIKAQWIQAFEESLEIAAPSPRPSVAVRESESERPVFDPETGERIDYGDRTPKATAKPSSSSAPVSAPAPVPSKSTYSVGYNSNSEAVSSKTHQKTASQPAFASAKGFNLSKKKRELASTTSTTAVTEDELVEVIDARSQRYGSLQMGDLIYLEEKRPGLTQETGVGLLHADGVCRTRLGLQKHEDEATRQFAPNFQECVFRICPPLNYEAAARTRELKRSPSLSGADLLEAQVTTQAEEQHEVARNARTLEQIEIAPSPVVYGELVQLQHVRSGKVTPVAIVCPRLPSLALACSRLPSLAPKHVWALPSAVHRSKGASSGALKRLPSAPALQS